MVSRRAQGEESRQVERVKAGDEPTFTALMERHRRELHVHCYRMLGSFEAAEDLVQETFLRAWRARAGFEGRATVRAWLYRIATNACLDSLKSDLRRALPHQVAPANVPGEALPPLPEVLWLEPYPDRLLDELPSRQPEPDAVVITRETIELAFLAAIQLLPPRQRAVLILREVLHWSATETASLLDISVPAVNSALQRARATLQRHRAAGTLDLVAASDASDAERALVERFVSAHERGDAAAVVELLSEDARATMPPYPFWFDGRDAVASSLELSLGPKAAGELRGMSTRANRQPAAAFYLRRWGDSRYRAFAIDVLRVENGRIAEITGFHGGDRLFAAFGLPPMI
jgi:RNA polymerase sigma-70 factor (ECF subfamily)